MARFQVTFDAADPAALSAFWAEALGYVIEPPPEGFESWDEWATDMGIPEENWNDARALVDSGGAGPRLFFQKVPEPKTAKNRVHLDVNVSRRDVAEEERRRDVGAAVSRLVDLGASVLGSFEEHGSYWVVMQDPEGNEFCVQ
jgi:hypothetical protein